MKFKSCVNKMCNTSNITHGGEDKYCWYCGSSLVSIECNCPCGRELVPSDKYCPKCGLKRGGDDKDGKTAEKKG